MSFQALEGYHVDVHADKRILRKLFKAGRIVLFDMYTLSN